jgi:hypothetical protein
MPDKDSLQLNNTSEVYVFLKEIGAPDKLIRHLALVGEAAELLIEKLEQMQVPFDARFVRLGVALHDAGKIQYPDELRAKGKRHEAAGEELLLQKGLAPELARCCISHGQWQTLDCSFEELLIALADTLWKGKRIEELEKRVIDKIAQRLACEPWSLFLEMDSHFELIAAGGVERLWRSE